MKIFMYIDRLNLLHKLIMQKRTGTPEELATRLRISSSRLYCILDEMKCYDAPIAYSRQLRTYYYTSPFELSISVEINALDYNEIREIGGGMRFFGNYSPLLFL